MKWWLVAFTVGFSSMAQQGGQHSYNRGGRQDYYRIPQVRTQQTHNGTADSRWYPNSQGKITGEHRYQVEATYGGAGQAGPIGNGRYFDQKKQVQTYRNVEEAESDAKWNQRTSNRLTESNRALARLQEAELVIAEEARLYGVPESMMVHARESLGHYGRAASTFRNLWSDKPADKSNLKHFDAGDQALAKFKSEIPDLQGASREAAERIAATVKLANADANWISAFGREAPRN